MHPQQQEKHSQASTHTKQSTTNSLEIKMENKELHERAMVPTMATHLQTLMKNAIQRYGNSKLMQELHQELDRIY